mmetsp:Transcript_19566/g.43509  ORF Transcript_19566/g.43509 Transcript_19566/m.43509 type:complete len:211 (-) Transcript_19566:72-704(-)
MRVAVLLALRLRAASCSTVLLGLRHGARFTNTGRARGAAVGLGDLGRCVVASWMSKAEGLVLRLLPRPMVVKGSTWHSGLHHRAFPRTGDLVLSPSKISIPRQLHRPHHRLHPVGHPRPGREAPRRRRPPRPPDLQPAGAPPHLHVTLRRPGHHGDHPVPPGDGLGLGLGGAGRGALRLPPEGAGPALGEAPGVPVDPRAAGAVGPESCC